MNYILKAKLTLYNLFNKKDFSIQSIILDISKNVVAYLMKNLKN